MKNTPTTAGSRSERPIELDRPELVHALDASGPAAAVICAPLGFGKSVLARQVADRWVSDTTWQVDADRLVTQSEVVGAIVDGLQELGDRVSCDTWKALPLDPDVGLTDWLADMPTSLLIVDGLNTVDAVGGIVPLVTALSETSRCGLRVVATARPRPTEEVVRLLARGAVTLLTEDDLVLERDEAESLVSLVTGAAVPSDRIDAAMDEVGGWCAGVAAIARSWQRATTEAAAAKRTRSTLELLDDYMLTEGLNSFAPEVRDLVEELGHLTALAPELCNQLRGRRDSAALLWAFRAGGGMISPGSSHDGWFTAHPALRGALRRRVHDTNARSIAVAAASAWFIEQGEPMLAIRSLAADKQWGQMRELVIEHLASLLSAGLVGEVAHELRAAPPDIFRADLVNVSHYAYLELATGNVNRALQVLNEMERFFSRREAMGANLVRASAGVHLTDPRPALAAGEAALKALDDPEVQREIATTRRYFIPADAEKYRVMLGGHLLIAGAMSGEWRRVQQHRRELLPEQTGDMATNALVASLGNRAVHLALAGELAEATQMAERGLAASVDGDPFVDRATASARYALGEAKRASADRAGAIGDLRGALERANSNNRLALAAVASASLAMTLVDLGDVAGAVDALADVQDGQFDRARTVAGLLATAQSRILVAKGDPSQAVAFLRAGRLTPSTATEIVAIALQLQDEAQVKATLDDWPSDPTVDNRVRRGLAIAAHGRAVGSSAGTDEFGRAAKLAARYGLVEPLTRLAEPLRPLLRAAARAGRSGSAVLCQRVLNDARFAPLPGRQLAVMQLLADGLTLPAIAAELNISASMVKKHTRAIYRALDVANRTEAVDAWAAAGDAGAPARGS